MTTKIGLEAVATWQSLAEQYDAPTAAMYLEAARVAESELAPDEYIEEALRDGRPGVARLLLAWADVLEDSDEHDDDQEQAAMTVALAEAAGFDREGREK